METINPTAKDAESAIRTIIRYIGEDPEREGLQETPERIIRMYKEIFRGYKSEERPKITTFENSDKINSLVFDSGDYYSMCEHHMLPFFGKYYFAYIPEENGRILGISKIARVVGYCAARLQLQERLAKNVIEMLDEALEHRAKGFAITMRGKHLCKTMRGVKNDGLMTVTYLTGIFKENADLRKEFYTLAAL
jgi:GTP cyclohydrolase I